MYVIACHVSSRKLNGRGRFGDGVCFLFGCYNIEPSGTETVGLSGWMSIAYFDKDAN